MASSAPASASQLSRRSTEEVAGLERELAEIELLIHQARIEAARHEHKRAQFADRLLSGPFASGGAEAREGLEQLVVATKRAALMEAQLDILEGKQRILGRFRDSISAIAAGLEGLPDQEPDGNGSGPLAPEMNRAVMVAQEDLRREIARQMHDGPAQSLTNIVLRAQIVERLMRSDPARAAAEVSQLVDMVQQTLESTKTFIFDVRPMVLDDLGLVPTLRRAARDRGRRAGVPVTFESMGPDRRVAPEIESSLFRVLDDAMGGYLSTNPTELRLRLDWTDDRLVATVEAIHPQDMPPREEVEVPATTGPETPPALAEMINQRRERAEEAADARARQKALPDAVWREIRGRAGSVELEVALSPDGRSLRAVVPLAGEAQPA